MKKITLGKFYSLLDQPDLNWINQGFVEFLDTSDIEQKKERKQLW